MSTISNIVGLSSKCAESVSANLGSFACPFQFQLPDGVILVTRGYKIPAATDVTSDFLLGKVQDGTFVPILDAFNFEPIDEDDVLETSNTGVNTLARQGLSSLKFTYKKGVNHQKALDKLLSYGVFDVMIVDKAGNLLGVDKSGDFGGYTAGMVLPKSKMWNDGSTAEGKSLEIQLTQPGERINTTWIEAGNLPIFLPTELDGKNEVLITFADANGPVVPAALDTSLLIKVTANDGITPVTGLATGDIRSVAKAISAVTEDGNGFYTLTITALAAETLDVQIYDVANSQTSVIVNGILFTGSTSVVVA